MSYPFALRHLNNYMLSGLGKKGEALRARKSRRSGVADSIADDEESPQVFYEVEEMLFDNSSSSRNRRRKQRQLIQ